MWSGFNEVTLPGCLSLVSVINHLLELLVCEAVQLDDELAVCRKNLCARVDYFYDVKLLSKSHLCAHFSTQIFNIFHLKQESQPSELTQTLTET